MCGGHGFAYASEEDRCGLNTGAGLWKGDGGGGNVVFCEHTTSWSFRWVQLLGSGRFCWSHVCVLPFFCGGTEKLSTSWLGVLRLLVLFCGLDVLVFLRYLTMRYGQVCLSPLPPSMPCTPPFWNVSIEPSPKCVRKNIAYILAETTVS